MRSKLHFFNVPVEEHVRAGSVDGPPFLHERSFLALLNASATPEDFVVLKIDIEGHKGSPELEIVRAIAETPELCALVDEIFFEYHFWFDGLNFGWKTFTQGKAGTVDDALRLMHRLRASGVRSHFWI